MRNELAVMPFAEATVPAVLRLWEVALPHSPVSERRLRGLITCPHFDSAGAVVVNDGPEAVGFIVAIYKKAPSGRPVSDTGYITVAAIHPDHQGTGLGSEVIAKAERYLRSHRLKRILATAFHDYYFFPGIDVRYGFLTDLFLRAGYEPHGEPVDMEVTWERYEPPSWLEDAERAMARQGIALDYARRRYHEAFVSFMRDHFPGTWHERARAHIESGEGLERAMLALDTSGDIVGFVRFGVAGESGYIDSIGVREDLRKKGIGSVLLAGALQGMANRGAKSALFGYTSAVRFYEKVGASIVRRYRQFRKLLRSRLGS